MRATRHRWRPLVWRVLAFAVVYAAAVAALAMGVGLTERDLTDSGIFERAYYALGLFVLGGLDIGTPVGGPTAARIMLWSSYFLAPIITVSALVEAALRLIDPMALRVRGLSDHVVLGGAGRLTLLYVRKLRETDPRRTVVVVERESNHPLLGELQDLQRVLIINGDIASDQVLEGLSLSEAHRVLLLTGDDFANLDAAAKMLKLAPNLAGRIVVHVSDLGLIRETTGSSVARDCDIFNGHGFAAVHLVQEHLVKRFRSTPERDLVVLAGFGRFGQTVLHELQQHASGSFGKVVIIDELGSRKARAFEEEPGFSDDYERVVLDGDLRDPELWRRIGDEVRANGTDPVVVLGSGDDGTNLQAALRVSKHHPGAYVIVRTFRSSPFATEVAQEVGAHAVNLRALIRNGMPQAWF